MSRTSGLASGLKKAPEPFPNLLMRQKLTALQRSLTALDGLDEAVFFREVSGDNVLHDFVRTATALRSASGEAGFEFGIEVNFHVIKIRERRGGSNVLGGRPTLVALFDGVGTLALERRAPARMFPYATVECVDKWAIRSVSDFPRARSTSLSRHDLVARGY